MASLPIMKELAEDLKNQFFAEMTVRIQTSAERAEWLSKNNHLTCQDCVYLNVPCVPHDTQIRCTHCHENDLRRCDRVKAEKYWRIKRKLGLSDEVFKDLLALHQSQTGTKKKPNERQTTGLKTRKKVLEAPAAVSVKVPKVTCKPTMATAPLLGPKTDRNPYAFLSFQKPSAVSPTHYREALFHPTPPASKPPGSSYYNEPILVSSTDASTPVTIKQAISSETLAQTSEHSTTADSTTSSRADLVEETTSSSSAPQLGVNQTSQTRELTPHMKTLQDLVLSSLPTVPSNVLSSDLELLYPANSSTDNLSHTSTPSTSRPTIPKRAQMPVAGRTFNQETQTPSLCSVSIACQTEVNCDESTVRLQQPDNGDLARAEARVADLQKTLEKRDRQLFHLKAEEQDKDEKIKLLRDKIRELEETPAADSFPHRFAEYVHGSLLRDGIKTALDQYDKGTISSRQAVDVFRSVTAQFGEGAERRQEELGLQEIDFGNILHMMNGQLEPEPEDNMKARLAEYLSSGLRCNRMKKVLADYDKRAITSRQTVVMFRSFLDLFEEDVGRRREAMDRTDIGYGNVVELMVGKRFRPSVEDDAEDDYEDDGHDVDSEEPPSKRLKTSKEG